MGPEAALHRLAGSGSGSGWSHWGKSLGSWDHSLDSEAGATRKRGGLFMMWHSFLISKWNLVEEKTSSIHLWHEKCDSNYQQALIWHMWPVQRCQQPIIIISEKRRLTRKRGELQRRRQLPPIWSKLKWTLRKWKRWRVKWWDLHSVTSVQVMTKVCLTRTSEDVGTLRHMIIIMWSLKYYVIT